MFYYEKPGEMEGDHDGSVEGCELTSSHTYNKKYMYMWNNSQSTDRKMTESSYHEDCRTDHDIAR